VLQRKVSGQPPEEGVARLLKVANRRLAMLDVFSAWSRPPWRQLVYKSTFLPKAIGVLPAIDALGYVIGGRTDFLAPGGRGP
jgi:hypothetical protein